MPFPLTNGFLSKEATTTLLTPLLIISLTQGGFLPEWKHGSSVVYNVEPASILIPSNATFSAWGDPFVPVLPVEMMVLLFETTTHPT